MLQLNIYNKHLCINRKLGKEEFFFKKEKIFVTFCHLTSSHKTKRCKTQTNRYTLSIKKKDKIPKIRQTNKQTNKQMILFLIYNILLNYFLIQKRCLNLGFSFYFNLFFVVPDTFPKLSILELVQPFFFSADFHTDIYRQKLQKLMFYLFQYLEITRYQLLE